jgi:hypothetical protein
VRWKCMIDVERDQSLLSKDTNYLKKLVQKLLPHVLNALYNSYLICISIEFNVMNVFRLTENECLLWDTNSLSKQYENHN